MALAIAERSQCLNLIRFVNLQFQKAGLALYYFMDSLVGKNFLVLLSGDVAWLMKFIISNYHLLSFRLLQPAATPNRIPIFSLSSKFYI